MYMAVIEVHKQTKFIPSDGKVIDNLSSMNREKLIYGFQFYNYLVVNNKVGDVLLFKPCVFIHNGEAFFTLKRNPLKP